MKGEEKRRKKMKGDGMGWKEKERKGRVKKGEGRRRNEKYLLNKTRNTVKAGYPNI